MLSRSWHFISVVVCLRNSEMCAISSAAVFPFLPNILTSWYPATAPSLCRQIDVVHQPVDMEVDLKNQQHITATTWPRTAACLSVCPPVAAKIEAAPFAASPPAIEQTKQLELLVFGFVFRRVPGFVSLFNASLNIICELLYHISPRALAVFYDWALARVVARNLPPRTYWIFIAFFLPAFFRCLS